MNFTLPFRFRAANTCVALCAVSLALIMSSTSFAQETPTRLRYTMPPDWTLGGDGRSLLPPGGGAAVTFAPSTPFTGNAGQWITAAWDDVAREFKVISGPVAGTQGEFLTRMGVVQQPDGARVWLVLNTLVKDGRGEAVIYMAGDEARFRQHLPALSTLLAGASVSPAPGTSTPAAAKNQNAAGARFTLNDYEFTPPQSWRVQRNPDHILLTQAPDGTGCIIQILPPQPSSGEVENDAKSVFDTMYSGWQHQKSGEQKFVLSKGRLPKGLSYCMMEASMSATDAQGRYLLEDGAALVVQLGGHIAIVGVRHRGLLAHADCLNKYETWRRFFNSFTVKNAPAAENREADAATRIIGVWSQSGGRAASEYVFAANGRYAFSGALGASWTTADANYEYLHMRTHAFEGDGAYSLSGDVLTLEKRGRNPERARFRFEQVSHGGAGWKDRLWLLTRDGVGEVEVSYERKTPPTAATAAAPSAAVSPAATQPSSAAPASTPLPAVRRGPPIPGAAEVAGLYRHTRQVFDASPFGAPGSGLVRHRMLYYLLSSDGRVFRGVDLPEAPGGDIESFDFDAARRRSPKDAGSYQVKGDEAILTMGEAPPKITIAARARDALRLNDPDFTYGERSFGRTIRALPPTAAELAPVQPPKLVALPAAWAPAPIKAWPTLVYQPPPGFTEPAGTGRHESRPHWHVRVEVYDFRPYTGKNLEQEFRTTRLRDWLRKESRESEVVGEPEFGGGTLDGADQMISVAFAEPSDELRTMEGAPEALGQILDRNVPCIRSRLAIAASGAVALIDVVLRDQDALTKHEASINAFSESVKVLSAPPPMTREEILAIAGNWAWDGKPGYGRDALLHHERAKVQSYVFSLDGRVAWSEGEPQADFRKPADFDRLSGIVDHTVGAWFKRGDQVVMRFGAPPFYVYSATIKGPNTLEILGYTYHRALAGKP